MERDDDDSKLAIFEYVLDSLEYNNVAVLDGFVACETMLSKNICQKAQ